MLYSSEEYINGLKRNDSKVIKRIYDDFFLSVESLIIKLGGIEEDAKDIFQEVLIDIVQRKNMVEVKSFKRYFLQACKNQWMKGIRKKKEQSLSDDFLFQGDEDGHFGVQFERRELRGLIEEKMKSLPEPCQKLLKLLELYDFSKFAEIAQELGFTNANNARQRTLVCRNKLKELLLQDPRFKDYLE